MDKPKDPIVGFRSVIKGTNSKGGTRIQLYLGGHQERGNQAIKELLEYLAANADNPTGVKLDLHINRKKTHDGTREFDSAFCFVKPVEQKQQGTWAPAGTQPAQTSEKVLNDL